MKTAANFKDQALYIGIDVHKKSWAVTILGEYNSFKGFTQPPFASTLHQYMTKKFPGADYYAAYEAGFCGFNHCIELRKLGINCIVVNPGDVPTKDKEKKRKSDIVDSNKIARGLRAKELEGIYIPSPEVLRIRNVLRYRNKLVTDQTRSKNRIKSFLHFNGITIPEEYDNANWGKAFIGWLEDLSQDHIGLSHFIVDLSHKKSMVKQVTGELNSLIKESDYAKQVTLLKTIPGIGELSASHLVIELADINRFPNMDKLCAFVGLIPNMAASGEKEYTGNITNRGNSHLKKYLIEASWIAISKDPELMAAFNLLCRRMTSNRAIIRIAKKLLGRIKAVLKTEQPYKINYNL